ncbi:hypothetical protein K9M16_01915 [Candidatus Babeliales bacterium]|nr:hypothetical protein [Candidatus Babeliales bacterium]
MSQEIKKIKIYPSIFNLLYYMLPFVSTILFVLVLIFITPKLLSHSYNWIYDIVKEEIKKVDVGIVTETEVLEVFEKPEKAGIIKVIIVYGSIIFSILFLIFLLSLEIIFFFKSLKRLIRYLIYKKPEIIIDNKGIQDFNYGLIEWDKIDDVYLNSTFNYIFYLGPWFPKTVYYLKLIPKNKKDEIIRITLVNIDKNIDCAFEVIKQYKDMKLGF